MKVVGPIFTYRHQILAGHWLLKLPSLVYIYIL